VGTWNSTNGIGAYVEFPLNGTSIGTAIPNTWTNANVYYSPPGAVNMLTVANSSIYFTGVQFEKGTIASPFEQLPYDYVLRQCQRYYWRWIPFDNYAVFLGGGWVNTTTQAIFCVTFPVAMRVWVTSSYGGGGFVLWNNNTNNAITSMSVVTDARSPTGCRLDAVATSANMVPGQSVMIRVNNNYTAYVDFYAEL